MGSSRLSVVLPRLEVVAGIAAAVLFLAGCSPGDGDAPGGDAAPGSPETGGAGDTAVAERYAREVEALAEEPAIREAFRVAEEMEPRTRRDQIALTEIPAPPFGEEARARAYADLLRGAGADSVRIDAEGNVLALRRGRRGKKTVAIAGHLDTVFPEGTDVTVRVRGDTLFAPGIGDDARGLAVVLAVLRALEEAEVATAADLLFIGTVGEEGIGDLRGVKHLFGPEGPRIDAWIAVDGGGTDRIVNRALGSHRYRVTVRGPGGHSWGAFGLGNPHHALGRAIARFVDAADPYTREGPRTSYNVGRIGGGTSVNSIPFESWMEVDMRSVDDARLRGIDSIFRGAVRRGVEEQAELRREGPPLELDVEMIGDRPSGEVPPSTPLVQRALAATRHFGESPSLARSSTDSNTPIARGVPAVTIGRGGVGGGGHSLDEWWLGVEAEVAIRRALLLTVAEAGLAGGAGGA